MNTKVSILIISVSFYDFSYYYSSSFVFSSWDGFVFILVGLNYTSPRSLTCFLHWFMTNDEQEWSLKERDGETDMIARWDMSMGEIDIIRARFDWLKPPWLFIIVAHWLHQTRSSMLLFSSLNKILSFNSFIISSCFPPNSFFQGCQDFREESIELQLENSKRVWTRTLPAIKKEIKYFSTPFSVSLIYLFVFRYKRKR